jgi:hypothetical protein
LILLVVLADHSGDAPTLAPTTSAACREFPRTAPSDIATFFRIVPDKSIAGGGRFLGY